MSSHSSEMDAPLIIPTMHTEDMDSPHWQERSVFVGGLPETHRAGPVVFGMVKGLGQITSIRNGSSGARNPHFTIIGFQTPRHARAAADYLKVPGPLVPVGLQPSAVTLDHVEFARQRVGRPFFPPGAPIPSANVRLAPYAAPRYSAANSSPLPPRAVSGGPPIVNGGQPLRAYGVGGVGNGFGGGNGHGHSNGAGGPPPPVWDSYSSYGGASPAGSSRGGMRSDAYSAPPSRGPTGYPGEAESARVGSPTHANGTMRAFPGSPAQGGHPDLAGSPSTGSTSSRTLAPLPASLFTPPTSADDLAAKLELARKTLRELDALARQADEDREYAKRAADRKEAEQEQELVVLRRELEAAKRSAVEMQIKAGATQKLMERLAKEDDKIGLSLSLIENLAHRARLDPGPAGALPPVPSGYDIKRVASSSTAAPVPASSSSSSFSRSPVSAAVPASPSTATPADAPSSGTKRQQEEDHATSNEGRPNAKQRRVTSSDLMDDTVPVPAAATPATPVFTAQDGEKMVRELARRQAEREREAAARQAEPGLMGKVGKAFSYFSGATGQE